MVDTSNNPNQQKGQVIKSSYSVLSNKPLTKAFSGAYYEIDFLLPEWFIIWTGRKIIKVYGCSFAYLESDNKEPKISTRYANQFITVNSNIVRDDTTNMRTKYDEELNEAAISHENESYMMTVNNFYSPKIYDVTNSNLTKIKVWFNDATGTVIPIRTSYTGTAGYLQEIYQAVFKIECELAIIMDG
jgi:hypothetical protein